MNFLSPLKNELSSIQSHIDHQKILSGKILARLNRDKTDEIIRNIHRSEFQVFSQWGDDGIIQFLIDHLNIEQQTFIEFGVENYKEATTRFLLINNNWKGLVMDGSEENISQIRTETLYWKHDLTAVPAFITKENINSLIEENDFKGEIGLLHIDIDGNDYWIWKEIQCIDPAIVIIEFNSVFGKIHPWTIPYDKDFNRTQAHFSNLYWGTSLTALCDLAEEKGYDFIGCNSHGNNAYFIRKKNIKNLKPLTTEEGYVRSKLRESRDRLGNLTYLAGDDRLNAIRGMNILNTRTGELEAI